MKTWLVKICKPSPLKAGVILSALLAFGYAWLRQDEESEVLGWLRRLDNQIVDVMFRTRGQMSTQDTVVIVDIDEKSLAKFGQWPWSRKLVAELVTRLHSAKPKVVGFDVVFAEPDRSSPKNYVPLFKDNFKREFSEDEVDEMDNDYILSLAIENTPTVMGYVFVESCDGLWNSLSAPALLEKKPLVSPSGNTADQLYLVEAYRATVNTEGIMAAFPAEGYFNTFPDPSGTVRKVPLFMSYRDEAYPSLAMQMLRVGKGKPDFVLHATADKHRVDLPIYDEKRKRIVRYEVGAEKLELSAISLGDVRIPTDENGNIIVNYRGGNKTFPYYPVYDVLPFEGKTEEELAREKEVFAALEGKYVLIGTSAPGLLDLRATPFSSIYPGVEVHANIIDNVLSKDFLRRDYDVETRVVAGLILLGGLILSGALTWGGALTGGIVTVLLLVGWVLGNYYLLFCHGILMRVVPPLLGMGAIFSAVVLISYLLEGRQKRYISEAFSLYLSPTLVGELVKNPELLSLEGEQKELTVLFSDIRGFTTISEGLNPHELSKFLNEYLTPMSNIVMDSGGTVDKFMGDAVMAFWGAPLDDELHATHAAQGALEMIRRLRELRIVWEARGLPFIDIGIGLNTGLMSVGNMGSETRFDYTVMGDNVNLGSRLEGQNKTYGTNILISESTRVAIGDRFFCRTVDLAIFKGKTEPIKIFELLCEGEPEVALKTECGNFEEAFKLFQSRDWDGAEKILRGIYAISKHKLYSEYLGRIEHYRQSPPPENWDGSFTHTTK
jgi:adenylate cyclase